MQKSKNKNQPDVSIILPVYNREKYVSRCIDSVLKQTFKNWELITIDDGSIDNSLKILKDYEDNFINIKVFTQPNMKLPLSRNRGIKESSGKYITFIDSDDAYLENHLSERIKYLNNNPDVDLIHGGVKIIGNEFVRDKNNLDKFIHLSECSIGATFFGKRNVFIELNGFKNITYSEDSEFLERAKMKFTIHKVEFPTYIYHRDVPDSITNSYGKEF